MTDVPADPSSGARRVGRTAPEPDASRTGSGAGDPVGAAPGDERTESDGSAVTSGVGRVDSDPAGSAAEHGGAVDGASDNTTVPGDADSTDAGSADTDSTAVPGDADSADVAGDGAERDAGGEAAVPGGDVWERRVADGLAFLRRRITGDYPVDDFGFDPELTEQVLARSLRPLYRKWFRVEVSGLANVPSDGAALLVGNHSGTIAMDGMMLQLALLDEHPAHRHLRLLGADFIFRTPVLSEFARKSGATLACNPDAERMLREGEIVGVFPEGFKGVGKRFADRYKLQRFGRGGFVSAALRTGTPIVPVSIVGAEEIYPLIGDIKPLARLLGIPYFPVTPLFPWLGPLGLVPLPSKWLIDFGDPIDTSALDVDPDDPMDVFGLADQVRETIQQTLHRLLLRRGTTF